MTKAHEHIKDLINSAGSRFVAIEFIKKDGSLRKMQVQIPAIVKHLKGEDASASAKQAVETRKANHPNLYAVYDVAAQAIRSVNLDTIQAVTVDKIRFEIRHTL